jgi:hypothetical protein
MKNYRIIALIDSLKSYKFLLGLVFVVFIGIFGAVVPVFALDIAGFMADGLAGLAMIIIELVGKLLIVLIEILIAIVQYNDFINAPAVVKGWILVRDVANMAFLIIFIAIAFVTILGVEKYEYKRLLPKLLLMAVAINFSKTICGIVIDAAQVAMITFVNGFKDVAAGNLIRGFGLADMMSFREFDQGETPSPSSVAAASILAVILLTIAVVTLGIIVLMFLVRIIYLWILIILSPMAFMLSAVPGAESKFNDWWQKFVKYTFVGPILAFFLWLSFSIMANVTPGSSLAEDSGLDTGFGNVAENASASVTVIGNSDQLLSYAIAIALLLLALSVANGMGTAFGSLAGDALTKIKSGGIKLGKVAGAGVLTGGIGGAAGYLGGKGVNKLRKTEAGKWAGRRLDDKFGSGVTKAIGKVGAKVLGKTDLGQAAQELAKKGTKFRVLKRAWKARADEREEERTAEEEGTARDVFNKGADGLSTNFAGRKRQELINKKEKEIAETTDNSTETHEHIISTSPSGSIEMSAALSLRAKAKDMNEEVLEGGLAEEIHQEALDGLSVSLPEEEVWLEEEEARVNSLPEGVDKKKDSRALKDRQENYVYMQGLYEEMKKKKVFDSQIHREIAFKKRLGDGEQAARYVSKIGQESLANGEPINFALASVDAKTGKAKFADLIKPENFLNQKKTVIAKIRNDSPANAVRNHPSTFRNEVFNDEGEREYLGDFSNIGKDAFTLIISALTDRNLGNMRNDGLVAMVAGKNINNYQDMYSSDNDERREGLRRFYNDLVVGYRTQIQQQFGDVEQLRILIERYNPDEKVDPKKFAEQDEIRLAGGSQTNNESTESGPETEEQEENLDESVEETEEEPEQEQPTDDNEEDTNN